MEYTSKRIEIVSVGEHEPQVIQKKYGIRYPLYFQCCKEALRAVLQNIEDNSYNATEFEDDSYNAAKKKRDGREDAQPLYVSNIITFVGGRGAGKTTAITEFGRVLENYGQYAEAWSEIISADSGKKKDPHFYVLPQIDASVLSTKDDLVEVILAGMYQMFNDEQRSIQDDVYEKMSDAIIQKFDEAYKSYLNMGIRDIQKTLGDSVLVKLRNTSSGLKTRAAFERLADSFLKLLDYKRMGCNGKDAYLVVTIDDLDMNPESGFEMLAQLQKYFSVRKVIILTAFKFNQMDLLSRTNFMNALMPQYAGAHAKIYKRYEGEAKRLTNDYLLKVLPLANRIYLPDSRQLHSFTKVGYGRQDKMDVKEFILKEVAVRMNILYDAKGLKKHFSLPNTVRELVSYEEFLHSLHSIKEIEQREADENGCFMTLYDQNHERFICDIQERFAANCLDDEQLNLYELIMERNLERRAGYMYCFLEYWMEQKAEGRKEKKSLHDSVDEKKVSYVELLEMLYKLGRNDYEDKVLVHCMLASFTTDMTREYYGYQYGLGDRRERAANRLKCFLGKTFGGRWLADAMPEFVSLPSSMESYEVCYMEQMGAYKIEIIMEYRNIKNNDARTMMQEVLLDILPYLECISNFFVNTRDDRRVSPEWELRIIDGSRTEEGTVTQFNCTIYTNMAGLDMFGFIGREIRDNSEESVCDRKLHEAMKSCLADYCEKHGEKDKIEKLCGILDEEFEKKSMWYQTERKAAFPYYNFDLSYNVMKRVRRRMLEDGAKTLSEAGEYYRTVYGYIAQYLKDEDMYYEKLFDKSGDAERKPTFYRDFVESPFIRVFGIESDDSSIKQVGTLNKKTMDDMLAVLIKSLLVNVIQPQQEDEMN